MIKRPARGPSWRRMLVLLNVALVGALAMALTAHAALPQISSSAAMQIQSIDSIKQSATVQQRKIDSGLYSGAVACAA